MTNFERELEKAAKLAEIFEPKYGGKDHSGYETLMKYEVNNYLNEAFESGAKWALDELSKTEGFEKRWIQYEDKYCIETCYPFDPSKANPIETLVDPELDDRPIVEFIELRALTAANAKLELNAEIISAKDAEIKSLEIKLRICNDRSLRTYDGLTDKADRADALEAENATLKAKLEKCRSQRDYELKERSRLYDKQENKEQFAASYIKLLDTELDQISAVENKVSPRGEKENE